MIKHGDGGMYHVIEFAVSNQYLGFAVGQHKRNGFGIQAHIEGIEHRPNHGHTKMHFEHGWNVGQHHCDRIVFTDTTPRQSRGQTSTTFIGLRPVAANRPMNHRWVIRIDAGRTFDKTEGGEGNMVDSSRPEALLKNRHDGHSGG